MKKLPIGLSDYKRLIEEGWYYIDKTLLIDEIISAGGIVTLLTRPRRFGKTLNLSMVRYFFEISELSNAQLFEDKKIWQMPAARALQGQFPVIFITFKDAGRSSTWQNTCDDLKSLIVEEFLRHRYLLDSPSMDKFDKAFFNQIVSRTASESDFFRSLLYLSRALERHHGKRVVILIDEYDSPIHAGFVHGYYKEIIAFMQSFLGSGLKDNPHLQWGIVTGILRAAKEDIFSGMNNPKVFTVLDIPFSDKFGFIDAEIDLLLKDYDLEEIKPSFKNWYNGYLIGNEKIYNPWSSLNCIDARGEYRPYWANTSSNALISKIIISSPPQVKDSCAELLRGNTIVDVRIVEHMALQEMESNPNAIWSLLLFSGYLTASSYRRAKGACFADLVLPNAELSFLLQDLVEQIFAKGLDSSEISMLKHALQDADGDLFSALLTKFISQSMSWHDILENEPEQSYHLFILGLLVVLSDSYAVRSNRESGFGRYDLLMIPKDLKQTGIVIEFKKKDANESIEECADRALQQIIDKNYKAELESLGIVKIAFFGIGCHKKQIALKCR